MIAVHAKRNIQMSMTQDGRLRGKILKEARKVNIGSRPHYRQNLLNFHPHWKPSHKPPSAVSTGGEES